MGAARACARCFVVAAPWLAVLGVLAALVARVRVEILRDADDEAGSGERGSDQGASDPSI